MTATIPEGYREHLTDAYPAEVSKRFAELREFVDRAEQRALDLDRHPLYENPVWGRRTQAMQSALHEVTWGMANAGLHYLLTTAAEADAAERLPVKA